MGDRKGQPPTTQDIERMFRRPSIVLSRPLLRAGVGALCCVRRFGWNGIGVERLRRDMLPLIFASNHQSHVDTAAILGTVPRCVRKRLAVAAALDVFGRNGSGPTPSLKRIYLEWIVAAGFHAYAFDRQGQPLRSLRTSINLIRSGWSLLLYPEGTRSRDGQISMFKAGVGVLARFTGRPVIPVHVSGGRQVLPCSEFLPRAGRISVRYGAPIWHREGESPEAFAGRLEHDVRVLGASDASATQTHSMAPLSRPTVEAHPTK